MKLSLVLFAIKFEFQVVSFKCKPRMINSNNVEFFSEWEVFHALFDNCLHFFILLFSAYDSHQIPHWTAFVIGKPGRFPLRIMDCEGA